MLLRSALVLTYPIALLAACTAHEKQVIKELEDMPGITCTTNAKDQTHCGPDSLSATQNPQ